MAEDEGPTKADVPSALADSSDGDETVATIASTATEPLAVRVPSQPSALSTEAATPEEALRQAELLRTRTFAPIMTVLGMVAAVLVFVLGGHPLGQYSMWIGVGIAEAGVFYIYSLTFRPAKYTESRIAVGYACCLVGLYLAIYYWGLFSPAPAVVVIGVFFVGIGRSAVVTRVLLVMALALHTVFAALLITEVLPDHGLISGDFLSLHEKIAIQAILLFVILLTNLIARSARGESERAIHKLDRAVREVSRREALLQEAKQQLDQALQVGGPGRFTDQTLGSYRLGNVIGRGAMGEVYDAVHTGSGQPAAVKLLHPQALGNPDHVTRFMREAEAAGKLRSPHVVRVLDVGDESSPIPWLAMERLRGKDLSAHLRERRVLPPDEVVDLISQVAEGIDAARTAGIVHRDIKPQNLFCETVDGAPSWKILDFGVSKLGGSQGTLTRGNIVGTPAYMAPEQARSEEVDYRADLYALAAVAYRSLTGQPPFAGKDLPGILYKVVYKMPARPTKLADELPRDVDRTLAIGMSKHPRDRFNSASDLAEALDAAIQGRLPVSFRRRADSLIEERPWTGG